MRTHTDDKTYQCSLCGNAFSKTSNLKNHLRSHSGDKPYECSESDKSFYETSDLKRHRMNHIGGINVCGLLIGTWLQHPCRLPGLRGTSHGAEFGSFYLFSYGEIKFQKKFIIFFPQKRVDRILPNFACVLRTI